ncbi:MAG: Holliday junction branch migration protein RuvA [Gaiella sp.]
MIARLTGMLVGHTPDGIVVEVGGVGYLVAATPSVLRLAEPSGGTVVVETYLHVREDALQLFGFATAGERELFTQLLTVSGIGPKVALAVVSASPADDLRRAIVLGDHARFQAIPGIGKKTAERIVLELREKVGVVGESQVGAGADGGAEGSVPSHLVARDALVGLGYSVVEAEQALASVDPELPPEERIRLVLLARSGNSQ